jgi:chemotaxis protein methyltransferase CheR
MTKKDLTADAIISDAYFLALRDHIIAATGLVFYVNQPQTLALHIVTRLRERSLTCCGAYLELLDDVHSGQAELDQIVSLLTIGETYFFRHRELFDALRDTVLPGIIERNQNTRRLRIWSAGCSIGAEAYSLAIVLRRDLDRLTRGWDISILGTDINRTFLAQALAGQYEEWAFRGTAPTLRRDCFERHDKMWRLAAPFRKNVSFCYHNLAKHPLSSDQHNIGAFDLILCRNVLIYFGPDFVESVTARLADCLVPGGWLALGHAEHGQHSQNALEVVSFPGALLYQTAKHSAGRTVNHGPRFPGPLLKVAGAAAAASTKDTRYHNGTHPVLSPPKLELAAARSAAKHHGPQGDTSSEMQRLRALADHGDTMAALHLCTAFVANQPLDPLGHFYHALLLAQTSELTAALGALQKTLYLDRKFVLAHYYSGLIHERLGHNREALASLRNVAPLLAGQLATDRLPDSGGLTIADLQQLTNMHLAALANQ